VTGQQWLAGRRAAGGARLKPNVGQISVVENGIEAQRS